MLGSAKSALMDDIGTAFLPAYKEFGLSMIGFIRGVRENMPELTKLAESLGKLASRGVEKLGTAMNWALPYIQKGPGLPAEQRRAGGPYHRDTGGHLCRNEAGTGGGGAAFRRGRYAVRRKCRRRRKAERRPVRRHQKPVYGREKSRERRSRFCIRLWRGGIWKRI